MAKPNNVPATTTTVKAANQDSSQYFALIVILVALVAAEIVFHTVMGAKGNFDGGDAEKGHPLNMMGTVYKGGMIVPILMTLLICVIVFSIERFMTLSAASGSGSAVDFIRKIKYNLSNNNVDAAIAECDKQKGSVANVVRAGLVKYKAMAADTELPKDQKVMAIQQEIEESTALEMPMLEKNLPILSTIATIGTLVALLGTVLGMIRAFSAMATSGSPDAVALSTGISEALINTAFGIGTSALAIVMYNYFTTRIDGMSYRIDEASFSIGQTFSTHNR